MTKEELKQEAVEYFEDETEGTFQICEDCYWFADAVQTAYVDSAEPREKRIAELEQKLEQTEKDLTDYQFNYPKIKDLEKENAELKKEYSDNLSLKDEELMCLETEFNTYKSGVKEILQTVLDKWKEERWVLQSDEEIKQIENLMEQAENILKE